MHLNTPVAAHITRLANLFLPNDCLYHVHGFRFHDRGSFWKNSATYSLEYLLSFTTDRYITINQHDHNIVLNKFKKISTLIPGVGVNTNKLLKIISVRNNQDKKIVGVVGTFNSEKGYDDLITVAKKFEGKIEFHCYGAGSYISFKNKTEQRNIKNIKFIGFDNDAVTRISEFDLLLHPSRREGLPVAVMEAMCLKTPIITTNIRGCRDLIEDKITGRLYEPGDTDTLIQLLNYFLKNNSDYFNYAEKAQVKCIKNYNAQKLAELIAQEVMEIKL